jgi:hypothetical protein
MESRESLKDRSTYYAVNKIIGILSKASVDQFIDLTYWGEKLTTDPEVKSAIGHIRGFLTDATHPARDLFERVFTRGEGSSRASFSMPGSWGDASGTPGRSTKASGPPLS